MKIEINHRHSGAVLFSVEAESWKAAIEIAVKSGADLEGANLEGADLRDANLEGANLEGADLEDGETLDQYITEVVPALLVAGGKQLADVAAAWDCHSWENCPMAVAFSCHQLKDVPNLYRPRVKQFIRLFDAGLLPKPINKPRPA